MKNDIDTLMEEHNLDAVLVTGPGQNNPPMVYLTGGAHLTSADLVKKRGEPAVLFCNPMERDEAARTGLATRNLGDYKLQELVKQQGGDVLKATVLRYQKMLADLGITEGRMGVYGRSDAGIAHAIFSGLQQLMPGLEIVGEVGNSLITQAMATKDEAEVERIRRMGEVTTAVVGQVAEFLSSHTARENVLVKADGQPLTIGDVKKRINLWLAERGRIIRKVRSLRSGGMRGCRTVRAPPVTRCASDRPSSLIFSRANPVEATIMILPGPGAWDMRRMRF